MAQPSTLALVTARGGSKGIPRKNIKPLGGAPLLLWGLRAIAASGVVDRTCVSTDDEEIAALARQGGADVPFLRPPALSGDKTTSIDVVRHALEWLEEHEGARPELVLLVQPTEPFVQPQQIAASLALLRERGADSAITMVPVPRNHHPFHVRERDGDGWVRFESPDLHASHPTRQDDPPRWAFGNLRWFRRDVFLQTGKLETARHVGLPIDPLSAIDLDSEEDWIVAEALIAAKLVP